MVKKKPSVPKIKNKFRHPMDMIKAAATIAEIILPTVVAAVSVDFARPRSAFGKLSAMANELAAGKLPSPMPNNKRMAIREMNDQANPVMIVKMDHNTTEMRIILLAPYLSERKPPLIASPHNS